MKKLLVLLFSLLISFHSWGETKYFYYGSGQIKQESNYKGVKLNGKSTRWFENGQIMWERYYRDGLLVTKEESENRFPDAKNDLEIQVNPDTGKKYYLYEGYVITEKLYKKYDKQFKWEAEQRRLKRIKDKAREEKRVIADAKKRDEKKKAAERKRVAELRALEEKKKAEEEKKKAEYEAKRLALDKKIKEQRVAEEKLKIALSLIPPQTKLQDAQNFINDIAKFVERYPNEFDIMDIAMFKINTKLIAEGVLNDVQMNHFYTFEKLVQTSSTFKKFQKIKENERNQLALKRLTQLIESIEEKVSKLQKNKTQKIWNGVIYVKNSSSEMLISRAIESAQSILDNPVSFSALLVLDEELFQLEKDIKTTNAMDSQIKYAIFNLNKKISKLKTYLTENISSISPELMTSIVEKVNFLEGAKKKTFTNNKEKVDVLKKANNEIENFILNNNLLTAADISTIKKAETKKKKAEEKKKVADAKRKTDDKERERRKNFKTANITCYNGNESQPIWICAPYFHVGDFLKITSNNRSKSYSIKDIENNQLSGCNANTCSFKLTKKYKVSVYRKQRYGNQKLILKIFDSKRKVLYEDVATSAYDSLHHVAY